MNKEVFKRLQVTTTEGQFSNKTFKADGIARVVVRNRLNLNGDDVQIFEG